MATIHKTFIRRVTSVDETIKFPVKYMPDDITTGVKKAQTTANTAQSTANKAKTTSDALGSAFFNDTVTFTYDGNTTGKAKFVYNTYTYYKISDYIPNVNYVGSCLVVKQNNDGIYGTYKGTNCVQYGGGLCIAVENAGSCTLKDTSFTVPERGLYVCTGKPSMTVKTVTFNMLCDEHYMFLTSSSPDSTKKFKMTVDDTGVPSFTDTGDAANKFTPVTPSELAEKQDVLTGSDKQSIVKTGMTSGAAWTAAEQKAARERMGIQTDAELIGSITVGSGGAARVYISFEGQYSEFIVGAQLPAMAEGALGFFLDVYTDESNEIVVGSSYGNASYAYSVRFEISAKNGLISGQSSGQVPGWGGGNVLGLNSAGVLAAGHGLIAMSLYTPNEGRVIPEGTIIKAYGVKI